MRLRPAVLAIVLATALAAPPLRAQTPEPRVRTELDTTLVHVGDRLILTVTVDHAPGATVRWPDSLDLAPFEALGAETLPPVTGEGTVTSGVRLTLTTFELGDLEVPSFGLSVLQAGDTTSLTTDAWKVTVGSVGLDEGGEIRNIKGPLAIARNVLLLLPWAVLALALLGAGLWWWRRRAPPAEEPARRGVEIPLAPHVVAHEALDRLEASGMLERGEIKEFHVAVSEIIRAYIEGRFDVYALEMTTGEVVAGLEDDLDHPVLENLRRFLERCDLVKFAKLRPPPELCSTLVGAARSLVDDTRPRMAPSVAPPTAPGGDAGKGAA